MHGHVDDGNKSQNIADRHFPVGIPSDDVALSCGQRSKGKRTVREPHLFTVDGVGMDRKVLLLLRCEDNVPLVRQGQLGDDALDAHCLQCFQCADILAFLYGVHVNRSVQRSAYGHVQGHGYSDTSNGFVVTVEDLYRFQTDAVDTRGNVPYDAGRVTRSRYQLRAAVIQSQTRDNINMLDGRRLEPESRQTVHLDAVVQLASYVEKFAIGRDANQSAIQAHARVERLADTSTVPAQYPIKG